MGMFIIGMLYAAIVYTACIVAIGAAGCEDDDDDIDGNRFA